MSRLGQYFCISFVQAGLLLLGASSAVAVPGPGTPTPGPNTCFARFAADDYVLDMRSYPNLYPDVIRMSKNGDVVVNYRGRGGKFTAYYYDFKNARFFTAATSNPTGPNLSGSCQSICDTDQSWAKQAYSYLPMYRSLIINPNGAVPRGDIELALKAATKNGEQYLRQFPGRSRSVTLTTRELGDPNFRGSEVLATADITSYDGCNNLGDVISVSDRLANQFWAFNLRSKEFTSSRPGSPKSFVALKRDPDTFWKKFDETYAVLERIVKAKGKILVLSPNNFVVDEEYSIAKSMADMMDKFRRVN